MKIIRSGTEAELIAGALADAGEAMAANPQIKIEEIAPRLEQFARGYWAAIASAPAMPSDPTS